MIVDLPDPSQVEDLLARWTADFAEFAPLRARYGAPASALRHFGLVHWAAQRLDLAAEAFGAALALTPDNSRLWADLAGAYDGLGDAARAEDCIRRSAELDPAQAGTWQVLANFADRRGDRDAAEAAYLRALALDPTLGDAHFGLGILYFNQRRLEQSAASLRAAITHGHATALGHACLGHVLSMASDFQPCAEAFEAAARFGPLDSNARRKYARARTFQAMIEGRTTEALAAYPVLAGEDREDLAHILRDAFSLFSAYGHTAAAIEIGRMRLAQDPDDPVQRYLLDAVTGQALTHAPADYVERYFDHFAPEYDRKLVDILHYRVPEQLAALVACHRARFDHILDLGCGTGLAGEHLKALGGRLTGLDLSGRMLDQAAKRGCYDELVKAQAVEHLRAQAGQFDLIFAADVLIYMGDLAPLLGAVALALKPSGLFASSIESAETVDFYVLPSGRFAHSPGYLERAAQNNLYHIVSEKTTIRLEANEPVSGLLSIFTRA